MTDIDAATDITLLEKLAEGVDPFTGEILPNEHLLQHPQVVRVLFHAIHALRPEGKKSQRNRSLPANAGMAWGKEEDEQLIQEFDAQAPIPEIAHRHGRTTGAITSRLVRLGKIAIRDEAYGADRNA